MIYIYVAVNNIKDCVDENHGHVLKGDLKKTANSKLRILLSKGANFREAM